MFGAPPDNFFNLVTPVQPPHVFPHWFSSDKDRLGRGDNPSQLKKPKICTVRTFGNVKLPMDHTVQIVWTWYSVGDALHTEKPSRYVCCTVRSHWSTFQKECEHAEHPLRYRKIKYVQMALVVSTNAMRWTFKNTKYVFLLWFLELSWGSPGKWGRACTMHWVSERPMKLWGRMLMLNGS